MENNEDTKKSPNIISLVTENDRTYYLCDDGFVYEANFEDNKMKKLDPKNENDKELINKVMSHFSTTKYDVIENDVELER